MTKYSLFVMKYFQAEIYSDNSNNIFQFCSTSLLKDKSDPPRISKYVETHTNICDAWTIDKCSRSNQLFKNRIVLLVRVKHDY